MSTESRMIKNYVLGFSKIRQVGSEVSSDAPQFIIFPINILSFLPLGHCMPPKHYNRDDAFSGLHRLTN
jgi:hypothetical protein